MPVSTDSLRLSYFRSRNGYLVHSREFLSPLEGSNRFGVRHEAKEPGRSE